MGDIIQLNEGEVKSRLEKLVWKSVEDTLNKLLDAEADQITQAHKYERTEAGQTHTPGITIGN